jgi:hypothetical protein
VHGLLCTPVVRLIPTPTLPQTGCTVYGICQEIDDLLTPSSDRWRVHHPCINQNTPDERTEQVVKWRKHIESQLSSSYSLGNQQAWWVGFRRNLWLTNLQDWDGLISSHVFDQSIMTRSLNNEELLATYSIALVPSQMDYPWCSMGPECHNDLWERRHWHGFILKLMNYMLKAGVVQRVTVSDTNIHSMSISLMEVVLKQLNHLVKTKFETSAPSRDTCLNQIS